MTLLRPSRSDDHLSNYWNALVRNAPAEELARLARLVEPSEIAAIERARAAHQRHEPDLAFSRRLEQTLMNTAISPIAGTIPQPRVSPPSRNGTRDLGPASRRRRRQTPAHTGWPLRPALVIGLVVLLILASAAGLWLAGNREDEPHRLMAPVVATPSPDASPGWSHFKGDSARRGETNFGPVEQPVELWRYQAGGPCNPSPAAVGETVYVACSDGMLTAFDAATGAISWQYSAEPFVNGPSVAGGVAYVVGGSGTIYAVDTASGTERWRVEGNTFGRSPAVAGDTLVAGTSDGELIGIDTASGTERWRARVIDAGAVRSPALADGIAYAGSDSGGLVAVDVASGEILWRTDTGTDTTGTATVNDGIVYVSHSPGDDPAALFAFDAKTGELLWQRDEWMGAPATSGTVGVSDNENGDVVAFDLRTGDDMWRAKVGGELRPVAISREIVYVPSDGDRAIYAYDVQTGDLLWSIPVDGGLWDGPAVTDGRIYVATTSGVIQAFGEGDAGAVVASPAATPIATARATPITQDADVETGEVLWKQPTDSWDVFAGPDGTVWVVSGMGFDIYSASGERVETWKPEELEVGSTQVLDGIGQVAFDASGNTYVGAPSQYEILKYDPDRRLIGRIGGQGSEDGQFLHLNGLATDSAGNIYASDESRQDIQKFSPDGEFILTFGAPGPGPGEFGGPGAIAVDEQDRLYIAEPAFGRVQQFSSDGELLAVFDGSGTDAGKLASGNDVAVDSAGNVYIVDSFEHRIVVFDPKGNLVGNLTGLDEGAFIGPDGIALGPDGTIYVADYEAETVMAIAWSPVITPGATPVASQDVAVALAWQSTGGPDPLLAPSGMAFDPEGNLWVTDTANNRFQLFSPEGKYIETWGVAGDGDGEFNFVDRRPGPPQESAGDIAFAPDGSFYVSSAGNKRIQHFSADREFLHTWGSPGTGDGQFLDPWSIAVAPDGTVYVSDDFRNDVQVFDPEGTYLFTFGGGGGEPGQFGTAAALTIDADGNVWVADSGNHRVQQFAADGTFIMTFGEFGREEGQFISVEELVFDHAGNLYVCDPDNGRIQIFTPDGEFLMAWSAADDGQGALTTPVGVIVDDDGSVYVTDIDAGTVQKFDVTLPAASPDATPVAAKDSAVALAWQSTGGPDPLLVPNGLAIALDGNLWVVDSGNNRFQILSSDGDPIETWGEAGEGDGEFNFAVSTDVGDSVGAIAFAPAGSWCLIRQAP